MCDVSAIVLTVGEKSTHKAIHSIRNQTLQPVETIIIKDKIPFHNAMNEGIKKIKSRFFIQVDADFILDNKCIELLRRSMLPNVAIAIGQLRDPIMGIISGVKLYRTESISRRYFNDSISPETDIINEVCKDGWRIIYTLNPHSKSSRINTLGEHNPEYTSLYTYLRYYRLGIKLAYRKEELYIRNVYHRLSKSMHRYALVAMIAFSNGLFGKYNCNLLTPQYFQTKNRDFYKLDDFLKSNADLYTNGVNLNSINYKDPVSLFRIFMELGVCLRNNNSLKGLEYYLGLINKSSNNYSWVGKAGLCNGVLLEDVSDIENKIDTISMLLQN